MKRIYILLWLLLPLMAMAQNPLSLEKCIELAKQNNKRISAAEFQSEAARYQRRGALSNYLPQFSITGTGLYSTINGALGMEGGLLPVVGADGIPTGAGAYFPGINFQYEVDWLYGAGIQVKQPIFTGGKITAGYKLSKAGETIALQNRRLTESEIVVETTRAYATFVRAEDMRKIAISYNELLKELIRSVEKAMSNGVKTRNDLLKVEVKLNESELNLLRAKNACRLAAMNLCHYIGTSLDSTIKVSTELPATDYAITPSTDITNRPEVQMLAAKSEAMRQKVKMARAEMLPQIGLVGQYGYMHGLKLAGNNLFDKWNFAAGVQLSIPIIGLGSHSKYRQAQMNYREARAEEEDKLGLMTLEVTQAANNLEEAAFEVRLAEKGVTSATENLRVSSSQYRVGTETLSDHLEAQTLWLEAEQTLINARINQFLRWIEYRKVTGAIN